MMHTATMTRRRPRAFRPGLDATTTLEPRKLLTGAPQVQYWGGSWNPGNWDITGAINTVSSTASNIGSAIGSALGNAIETAVSAGSSIDDAIDTALSSVSTTLGLGQPGTLGHYLTQEVDYTYFYIDINAGCVVGVGAQIGMGPDGNWGFYPYSGWQTPGAGVSIAPGYSITPGWNTGVSLGEGPTGQFGWSGDTWLPSTWEDHFLELGGSVGTPVGAGTWYVWTLPAWAETTDPEAPGDDNGED